jgi:uncharacterized membrane protein
LDSVDWVRGLVILLMALDHVRDFVSGARVDPTDLDATTLPLFLTRWVTHFCAPTFVLLAGLGAALAVQRGAHLGALSRRLVLRGLWLILLEVTVIRAGMTFRLDAPFVPLLVLWVIGVSMVVLGVLVWLPKWVTLVFGMILVGGHNLLDGVDPASWGNLAPLWRILHVPGPLGEVLGHRVFVLYPVVPWVGVMALGWCLGGVYRHEAAARNRALVSLGLALSVFFVMLRVSNRYGDPRRWHAWEDPIWTFLDILNCEKYPPSLCYLLMTLGPALVVLGVAGGGIPGFLRVLIPFGRVPQFFYVVHWYVVHGLAIGIAWACGQPYEWLLSSGFFGAPAGYGHGLGGVYLAWLGVLGVMYPLCWMFARWKELEKHGWLRWF